MPFNDVFAKGAGISIPKAKFDAVVRSGALQASSTELYKRDRSRKVPVFAGFETFFDGRSTFRCVVDDDDEDRIVLTPA